MEEPSTFKLSLTKDSPSTTHGVINIVLAFPRELDARHPAPLTEPAVETAPHRDELKLSHASSIELDERGADKVQVFAIPEFHRRDAPAPNKHICRLWTCHAPCSPLRLTLRVSGWPRSGPSAATGC